MYIAIIASSPHLSLSASCIWLEMFMYFFLLTPSRRQSFSSLLLLYLCHANRCTQPDLIHCLTSLCRAAIFNFQPPAASSCHTVEVTLPPQHHFTSAFTTDVHCRYSFPHLILPLMPPSISIYLLILPPVTQHIRVTL